MPVPSDPFNKCMSVSVSLKKCNIYLECLFLIWIGIYFNYDNGFSTVRCKYGSYESSSSFSFLGRFSGKSICVWKLLTPTLICKEKKCTVHSMALVEKSNFELTLSNCRPRMSDCHARLNSWLQNACIKYVSVSNVGWKIKNKDFSGYS